jgi:hypothetical protein
MRKTLMMGVLLAASAALAGGHHGGSGGGGGGGGARAPSHGAPPPSRSGTSVSPARSPSASSRLQPSAVYPARPYGHGRGYAAPFYVAPLPYYGSYYYYDNGSVPPSMYPSDESGSAESVTQPAEIPPPPPDAAPPESLGPSPEAAPPPPNAPPPPPPQGRAPNASESMGAPSDITEDTTPGPAVYHWVDEDGVDNYSTTVPPEYRSKATKIGGQLSGIVWSAPSTK